MLTADMSRPANVFRRLFNACFECGCLETNAHCPTCSQSMESLHPPPPMLGARIYPTQDSLAATVVEVVHDELHLIADDGLSTTRPAAGLTRAQFADGSGASSPERLLLAVSRWQVPAPASDRVLDQALNEAARCARRVQLRVAQLAYAAGRTEFAEQLRLPETTRTWFEAESLIRGGELDQAAALLTGLPAGRFPARLCIWAAMADSLSDSTREAVLAQLETFAGSDPFQNLAVATLAASLNEGEHSAARVADSARAADPALCARYRERAERSGASRPGQLLQLIRVDPQQLRDRTDLVSDVPTVLVDQLIDDGVIGRGWLDDDLPPSFHEHIAARLDPIRLPDEALDRLGMHEERARRAIERGEPIPATVPAEVAAHYQALDALRRGEVDSAALAELAREHQPELVDALKLALADPKRPPTDGALQLSGAMQVLAKPAVDHLDLAALGRSDLTDDQARFVGAVAIERSRRSLYEWSYDAAIDHAKDGLRLCHDELIRDEALNLIAACSWLRGDDEAALKALETAIEGQYTVALQANIGLVAQELDPEAAGRYLARLVSEAPDLRLRTEAAKRALAIWQAQDIPGDQANDLPEQLAVALRALLLEPLGADDFLGFARLLADHDADWMATFDTTDSPNANSPAAKLFSARARGIEEFISTLGTHLSTSEPAPWVATERDMLVGAVIDALLDDEPHAGAVGIAELILDHQLPLPLTERITLRGLTARMVAYAIVSEDEAGEPAIRFLEGLESEQPHLEHLTDDERERATQALEFGWNSLARAHLVYRWQQLQDAATFHDEVAGQIAYIPRWRRDQSAVQQAASQIEQVAIDSKRLLERLRRHANPELVDALTEAIDVCNQLTAAARALSRM
jgi:hypothetical protein